MRTIRRLIIHHSGAARVQTVESIRRYHDGVVPYHLVIDGLAVLHHTKPIEEVGAHDAGENSDSIGLCLIGDNTTPGQEWTREQIIRAKEVVLAFKILWPEGRVLGHRDEGPGGPVTKDTTLCPGVEVSEVFHV